MGSLGNKKRPNVHINFSKNKALKGGKFCKILKLKENLLRVDFPVFYTILNDNLPVKMDFFMWHKISNHFSVKNQIFYFNFNKTSSYGIFYYYRKIFLEG